MFEMFGQPEIERRGGIGGGDKIPAGTPAADVVERGERRVADIGRLERLGLTDTLVTLLRRRDPASLRPVPLAAKFT